MSFFKNHWLLTLACVIIILPAFSFLSNRFYYAKALALLETGNYAEAFVILNDLGSYRDSAQYAKIIKETYNSDLVKLISCGFSYTYEWAVPLADMKADSKAVYQAVYKELPIPR